MAILVAGAAGYMGRVTVERLKAKNECVIVLDDLVRGHQEEADRGGSRVVAGKPYGWTKFALERLLDTCDTAYDLNSICLRYFYTSGATERCGEFLQRLSAKQEATCGRPDS